jgi:hypothetical protein
LPSRLAGLREGLQAAGYREPDNIEIAADGDPKRITSLEPSRCFQISREPED